MSAGRCALGWEVEASRDGRLDDAALADALRHRATCTACAREAERLEAIAQRIQASGPAARDALAMRRLRTRILTLGDDALILPSTARRRRIAIAGAVALVGASAFVLALHRRADAPRAPTRPSAQGSAAPLTATPLGSATWSTRDDADASRVVLEAGTLRLVVARHPGDLPVFVELPDGVIEDRGTTFSVEVRDGATYAIDVDAGEVRFGRLGAPPIVLRAGARWRAPPIEPRHADAAPSASASVDAPIAMRAPPPSSSGRVAPPVATAAPATSASAAPSAAASGPPGPPASTGSEDAAYLQVLALTREGRRDEARLAARAYLARFPSGFRRAEVNEIAH